MGSCIGEIGLGSCVFTKKGFLDSTGIGDRGVRGSYIWYWLAWGKSFTRGDVLNLRGEVAGGVGGERVGEVFSSEVEGVAVARCS